MAIRSNLIIDQGSDVEFTFSVTDDEDQTLDLTGYTGAAQMRKHFSSTNSHSFSVDINENTGVVTLSMNSATTGNISHGRYVYDCEITSNSGVVFRLVEGIVTIKPQVTK